MEIKYLLQVTIYDLTDLNEFEVQIVPTNSPKTETENLLPIRCPNCSENVRIQLKLETDMPLNPAAVKQEEFKSSDEEFANTPNILEAYEEEYINEEYLVLDPDLEDDGEQLAPCSSLLLQQPKKISKPVKQEIIAPPPSNAPLRILRRSENSTRQAEIKHDRKQDESSSEALCPICAKIMPARSMKKHMAWHHPSPDEKYACGKCGKWFKNRYCVNRHHKEVHERSEETRVACPECSKVFDFAHRLRTHMKVVHSQGERERRYACPTCDARFYDNTALRGHVQSKHLNERKFICHLCGNGYNRKSTLIRHMHVHNPPPKNFVCSYCPRRFIYKKSKMVHERIHTGERPYVCTYPNCKARFYDDGTFRQHKLGHVKKDKGLTAMPLTEVAKIYHPNGGKFEWEL